MVILWSEYIQYTVTITTLHVHEEREISKICSLRGGKTRESANQTFHLFVVVMTLKLPEDVGQVTGIETQFVFGKSLRVVNPGGKHLHQIGDESRHRRRKRSVQVAIQEYLTRVQTVEKSYKMKPFSVMISNCYNDTTTCREEHQITRPRVLDFLNFKSRLRPTYHCMTYTGVT